MRVFSDRQWQLINLAANGSTDKEIAHEMGISVGTVRTYWDRLRRRYECRNRSEVVVKALFQRANDDFNAKVLNSLPLFIWKTDAKGAVSFKNDWFSASHPNPAQSPTSILAFVAQEERAQLSQELSRALQKGDRFEKVATFVVGPKGSRKPHKIMIAPMKSTGDRIDHWIGYGREMAGDADEQMLSFLQRLLV